MRCKREICLAVSILAGVALSLIIPGLGIAGSLEPPASAVDGNGNPVPTMMAPPSWSQKLPASERFVMVLDGEAVLDKETGLVWEKNPWPEMGLAWDMAVGVCASLEKGTRKGWHLPTIGQLSSLIDTSVSGSPKLPSGHPFSALQSFYWSSTSSSTDYAYGVTMSTGALTSKLKSTNYQGYWCVRGGEDYGAN